MERVSNRVSQTNINFIFQHAQACLPPYVTPPFRIQESTDRPVGGAEILQMRIYSWKREFMQKIPGPLVSLLEDSCTWLFYHEFIIKQSMGDKVNRMHRSINTSPAGNNLEEKENPSFFPWSSGRTNLHIFQSEDASLTRCLSPLSLFSPFFSITSFLSFASFKSTFCLVLPSPSVSLVFHATTPSRIHGTLSGPYCIHKF